MLKIGEFSRLSHLTVKALRFYEKEGLLKPKYVDATSRYRYYDTAQLERAAHIKAYRQLGLSIEEIKAVFNGEDTKMIFAAESERLHAQKRDIEHRLAILSRLMEEKDMNAQVIVKHIPETIVYYSEVRISSFAELMTVIPNLGEACLALNPDIKCPNPGYEFCEYPEAKYREKDILIRHNEAVDRIGKENDLIKFKVLPPTTVLSILHKGPYSSIGETYAYLMKYIKENHYKVNGLSRECYIDGIWNKDSEEDWLTEIQFPIEEENEC